MNNALSVFLLISAPGLPLLLAFPAVRSRLPWPGHISLLPAFVLLFLPENVVIELPWILLDAGLGIDTVARWWLAMSVVIWAAAAVFLPVAAGRGAGERLTTLFLLTLAGQLGAILATDIAGFFTFMTLMGYAFIGLLAASDDEAPRRAGRIYLVLSICADIVLFEALLIAATVATGLEFASVAQAMSLSTSSALYLSMAIVGFALKAGLWPLHLWLPLAYRSTCPALVLLLWVTPVATGLLGAVRWLPLGQITAPIAGTLLLCLGAVAILYALFFGLTRVQPKQLPAYAAIIATGIFTLGLGAGLIDPAVWKRYGDWAPVFVAAVGFGLTIVISGLVWSEGRGTRATDVNMLIEDGASWYERWPGALLRWGREMGFNALPGLRTALATKMERLRQPGAWQAALNTSERSIQRWQVAVTLLILLGTVVAFVAATWWR